MTLPSRSRTAPDLVALIPDLRRLARRLTRDAAAAEDLAQEALMRVWAHLVRGEGIDDLKPYLMTAARNLARRPGRATLALADAPEPVALSQVPGRLALRKVAAAMARMPEPEVRLMLRQVAQGESYAEIARAEGLPIGTVMSRLARLRARLRSDCGLPADGPAAARLTDNHAA